MKLKITTKIKTMSTNITIAAIKYSSGEIEYRCLPPIINWVSYIRCMVNVITPTTNTMCLSKFPGKNKKIIQA